MLSIKATSIFPSSSSCISSLLSPYLTIVMSGISVESFSSSSVVDPACTPTFLPFICCTSSIPLSAITTKTSSLLKYDLDRHIDAERSGDTDMPFHMQSIFPLFSSSSFFSHSIGCFTRSIPSLLHTSCAMSISNPTISPDSSLNPMGG